MLDNATWAWLVSPTETYHITPYAWAVAPGDDDWYQRLEQFVNTIKRGGRLAEAARRYGLTPIVMPH